MGILRITYIDKSGTDRKSHDANRDISIYLARDVKILNKKSKNTRF